MSFGRIARGDPFDDFLQALAHEDSLSNKRFVARNFLLDEGVSSERRDSYSGYGTMQAHASFGDWHGLHRNNYLLAEVFLTQLAMPVQLDIRDRENCPEAFRSLEAFRRFGAADERLELIRVTEADGMAKRAGLNSVDDLLAVVRGVLTESPPAEAITQLNSILEVWQRSLDLRPVWAAFWEDVRPIFEPAQTDWADQLRDQLGLYHLSPHDRLRELPIFVFRYPISALPRVRGYRDIRPLTVPTVLDGNFSEAFCPAPAAEPCGYVVHLGADYPIRREILHPSIQFRAEHLFRIGVIKRSVPADLWEARKYHLLWIRTEMEYPDYGVATDGTLA